MKKLKELKAILTSIYCINKTTNRDKEIAECLGKLQDFYTSAKNGSRMEYQRQILKSRLYWKNSRANVKKELFLQRNNTMNENEKTMFFAKMCDLEALFTTISSRLNSALFSLHLPFSIFVANIAKTT